MRRRIEVILQRLVMPDTPVGPLTLLASSRGLREIRFGDLREPDPGSAVGPLAGVGERGGAAEVHLEAARARLGWMLAPLPGVAAPLPDLDLDGGTPFQRRVWQALLEIPRGELRSYGELAAGLGRGSPRAVGQAVGANPLPILVPCHRVVAANGRLGGYSGGRARKVRLLEIEGFRLAGPGSEAAGEAPFEARLEARRHAPLTSAPEAR